MNNTQPERSELEQPTGVPDLDPVLHFPKRTMIMAVLSAATVAEFSFLKEQLELTDSDLSKQMRTLAEAGYVDVRKIGHGRSGSTEYSATRKGRKAYANYKKQLARMLGLSPEV